MNPQSTTLPAALNTQQLRQSCQADELGFKTTEDLDQITALIGQDRALGALRFAAEMKKPGFNVFALGTPSSGRHGAIRAFLKGKAANEAIPDDWVYVNNFKVAHQPIALRLPAGMAIKLRTAMENLIDDLATAIPTIFESDEYRNRRQAIDQSFEQQQETMLEALRKKAAAQNIGILRTQEGFSVAPIAEGQIIPQEQFNALPAEQRDAIEEAAKAVRTELTELLGQLPAMQKEHRKQTRNLHAQMVSRSVEASVGELFNDFADHAGVQQYLEQVREDLVVGAGQFLKQPEGAEQGPMPPAASQPHNDPRFRRYSVNIMVAQSDPNSGDGDEDGVGDDADRHRTHNGAPVITEEYPTLGNLVGRIEHISQMGALMTDFSLIKPGALHRANGGYLLLDARRVLSEPFAWEALKRCLRNRAISITSGNAQAGAMTTITLDPDPIPLSVKVVLIGDRSLYYMLANMEPDFPDLFKVQADFDETVERTKEMTSSYARLLGTMVSREKLKHLTAEAVARVIDETVRMADDNERLSLRVGPVADILREADYWAGEAGKSVIDAAEIERAIEACRHRADRSQRLSLEQITRGTILIDTQGEAVGQINGLSVLSMGQVRFGRPTRITARVRMGSGKFVDIEREVELGGPLHSKGVLILSSYLSSHYALDLPMSLWASLVFEQSYGGVDGDSASSTELYALLSALSGIPIQQGLAVTGSVNQRGEVQAIGGVNEKIEGFFEVCRSQGLTGRQGVLIPESNVKNLMLRKEVVAAADAGEFHIYPVTTINQGISLLTGAEAGERGSDGRYPEGSINAAVEAKLIAFAKARLKAINPGAADDEALV